MNPDLLKINGLLRDYQSAWDSVVDSWLVIRIGDPQVRECGRACPIVFSPRCGVWPRRFLPRVRCVSVAASAPSVSLSGACVWPRLPRQFPPPEDALQACSMLNYSPPFRLLLAVGFQVAPAGGGEDAGVGQARHD